MKKAPFLLLGFILCLSSFCIGNNTTLDDLRYQGFLMDYKQSFSVTLESWGKVQFISGTKPIGSNGKEDLCMYLVNDKEEVLYSFPYFSGNDFGFFIKWTTAVSFRDVNKDGLKDIIIMAEYLTGIGKHGTDPFQVCTIYFQQGKKL